MDMNRTLHDTNNAQRILKLTADTMLLVDKNGVCIDIDPHCDLWFLQDEILLGKNIFEFLSSNRYLKGKRASVKTSNWY